ncbi:MAG TPA: hypothetical protein VL051_16095, partial [Burkholderiaceae bacterium]|nr:hypothetical protein [Burkholderiaceae bacterium]
VVITILGILAAIALPRFAALQADARIAKMNGALASIKAGAVLAHSLQLTQGVADNGTVTMEGVAIQLYNGYPDASSIALAAGLAQPDYYFTNTATTLTVRPNSTANNPCFVTYQRAAPGLSPTYSNANLDTTNCK